MACSTHWGTRLGCTRHARGVLTWVNGGLTSGGRQCEGLGDYRFVDDRDVAGMTVRLGVTNHQSSRYSNA